MNDENIRELAFAISEETGSDLNNIITGILSFTDGKFFVSYPFEEIAMQLEEFVRFPINRFAIETTLRNPDNEALLCVDSMARYYLPLRLGATCCAECEKPYVLPAIKYVSNKVLSGIFRSLCGKFYGISVCNTEDLESFHGDLETIDDRWVVVFPDDFKRNKIKLLFCSQKCKRQFTERIKL